jgi:hypothetical protein
LHFCLPLQASAIGSVCGVAGFSLSVLVCLSSSLFVRLLLSVCLSCPSVCLSVCLSVLVCLSVVCCPLSVGCCLLSVVCLLFVCLLFVVCFGRRAVLLVPVVTAPDE